MRRAAKGLATRPAASRAARRASSAPRAGRSSSAAASPSTPGDEDDEEGAEAEAEARRLSHHCETARVAKRSAAGSGGVGGGESEGGLPFPDAVGP